MRAQLSQLTNGVTTNTKNVRRPSTQSSCYHTPTPTQTQVRARRKLVYATNTIPRGKYAIACLHLPPFERSPIGCNCMSPPASLAYPNQVSRNTWPCARCPMDHANEDATFDEAQAKRKSAPTKYDLYSHGTMQSLSCVRRKVWTHAPHAPRPNASVQSAKQAACRNTCIVP